MNIILDVFISVSRRTVIQSVKLIPTYMWNETLQIE